MSARILYRSAVLAMALLCCPAFAADHYIVPGLATGTHTGANCTNAYSAFGTGAGQVNPASLTRGDTYWILAGTIAGVTFSTTASGTTPITIEAATSSSHGAAADCGGLYGQAVIGQSTISTNYWTFSGNGTRNADWRSGYVLKVNNNSCPGCNGAVQTNGAGLTGLTFDYVEVVGSSGNYSGTASDDGLFFDGGSDQIEIEHSWIHDVGTDLIVFFSGAAKTFTIEYNVLERNHTGLDSNHSQAIGIGDTTNIIVRYNYFRDITNTGIMDDDNSNGTTIAPNWYFYGNTIYWTTSVHLTGTSGLSTDSGIGLFGGEHYSAGGVIQIYNNTVAGINGTACNNGSVGCTEVLLEQTNNPAPTGTMPTVTVYNNLFYNNCTSGDTSIASSALNTATTADYSEVYCPPGGCTVNANCLGSQIGGAHAVTSNTGNPFVNADFSSHFNFNLISDTTAGLSITNWSTTPAGCSGNCENIDPPGTTRGANGTIDRGAFQIASGTSGAPSAPSLRMLLQ